MSRQLDPAILECLAAHASDADEQSAWPATSWETLRQAGVMAWSIPARHGGEGRSTEALLAGYEDIAAACLTTAFILSQREAAVRRLRAYPALALQERFLPLLARGACMMTVGLSQLTTSRQHGAPSLRVVAEANDHRLNGVIPWVTAADQADCIVVGGTQADGKQLLFLMPRGTEGVTIEPPLKVASLLGSRTTAVRCDDVFLAADWLLAGPAERILTGSHGGVGGVETSCLALGLARAALEYVEGESTLRGDLGPVVERLRAALTNVRQRMLPTALAPINADEIVRLRVEATRLALHATQVALIAAKGAGFVVPHPAQRWARQALFFLVWSCPRPTAEGLVGSILTSVEGEAC